MGFLKKSGPVEWLLVCLGNPGKQYENTRHNIGFMAADLLSEREGVKLNKLRYRALTGEMTLGGARVLVIKPQTYMNLSGEAVKLAGSAGGHNGLKNIIAHLGTDAFPRIKVGVGAPAHPEHEMVDWVIGNFSGEEKKVVRQALEKVIEAVECVVEKGVGEAQNRYN